MDPTQLFDLLAQRKWVAATAIVVGLIVRLLKSDTKIPINIPPRVRAWLALGLGAVAGAIDKLVEAGHTTWTTALLWGVTGSVFAMVMHALIIDSIRGGKELVVPGLTKMNTPPGSGRPPSVPPTAGETQGTSTIPSSKDSLLRVRMHRGVLWRPAFVLFVFVAGCSLFQGANLPKTVLTLKQIACIAENAFVNDTTLNTACELLTGEEKAAGAQVAGSTRAGMTKAGRAAPACAMSLVDAGVEGGK